MKRILYHADSGQVPLLRTYIKYSMVFTPPFIASLLSALLSEPKGSAVASKAPITLCPTLSGDRNPTVVGFSLGGGTAMKLLHT